RIVAVGVSAAAQAQLSGLVRAQLGEHPLVVGEYLLGYSGRSGDQHDPGRIAAAQLDEPFKQPGAAAPVFRAPDDEQPASRLPVLHVPALVPGLPLGPWRSYPP